MLLSWIANTTKIKMTIIPANYCTRPIVGLDYGDDIVGSPISSSYDMRAEVPEVTRFAPLETKRFIFDFHIGQGETRYYEPPGTFQFKGAYGGVWAPNAATVVVSP